MEWWSRLVSGAPKRPSTKGTINDPTFRFAKFRRNYDITLKLCNQSRNLSTEGPLLDQFRDCLEKIALLIREESRAPAPHYVIQYAASNRIYTGITRAATASHHEPIIEAAVSILAALIDSEEEDFLSNNHFAKSLMRMAMSVTEAGKTLISAETETAVLELLFTIAAKIRLQPGILPNWFHSTTRIQPGEMFAEEKNGFVGTTAKSNFPLSYLLVDRVHHEGRIGDFARTGLLYIFEATGRSSELEEWIISSDLPTLMASGLGALYSQLSRELSILHPDATLPAVLAMSDYSTTHARATAESAFFDKHKRHMSTFLSYLAFWQDVLDHSKSADVKRTLLDHFQILFLQQVLYPSLLQSSDTDAGSSVAVLTYVSAMLESLEYPDLVDMLLKYLLGIEDNLVSTSSRETSADADTPPSPTAVRRKQSLILLVTPKDPESAVDPALFNLVDLILNNMSSSNAQSAFAALKLASTILTRHKHFALGSLLRTTRPSGTGADRTVGAFELETERFAELAASLHHHVGLEDAYASLVEDARTAIEAQIGIKQPAPGITDEVDKHSKGLRVIVSDDYLMKSLLTLLKTFLSNSVDVNLALSQTIISIAQCLELRLDGWFALDPSEYNSDNIASGTSRTWQAYLDDEEIDTLAAIQKSARHPRWNEAQTPALYAALHNLTNEIDTLRSNTANFDNLITVRKTMLQATSLDTPLLASKPPSEVGSPIQANFLNVTRSSREKSSSANSRTSSAAGSRREITDASPPQSRSDAVSPASSESDEESALPAVRGTPIFLPPPPEIPSTTDLLMQQITLPVVHTQLIDGEREQPRTASLNHILTNVVVLQEFVLELVAVLQVRAAVLGDKEVRYL